MPNIITKRYPYKIVRGNDGKTEIEINLTAGEVVPSELSKEVTEELNKDNIIKLAGSLAQLNEKKKSIKLSFGKDGNEGTIDFLYLA